MLLGADTHLPWGGGRGRYIYLLSTDISKVIFHEGTRGLELDQTTLNNSVPQPMGRTSAV